MVLGVLAAVLFAQKIKGQGNSDAPGKAGSSSSDVSNDWQNYIGNITAPGGQTGDLCVECVLCSECFSNCTNIGISKGLNDVGELIGCPATMFVPNTDEYWSCACNVNRGSVEGQIGDLAVNCLLPNAQSNAVSTFSDFCNFIVATATTSTSVPTTVTNQNPVSTTQSFATTSPETSAVSQTSTINPTTSTSNSNVGLSSLLLINDEG
jgi:hypothetical protein